MKTPIALRSALALILLVAAVGYFVAMTADDAYRTALDHAGDELLPGASLFQDAGRIAALAAAMTEAGRKAYGQFLEMDNLFVLLLLALFLSVAWMLAWRGWPPETPPSSGNETLLRRWCVALVAAALLYAGADWAENHLVREILSAAHSTGEAAQGAAGGADVARARWVTWATTIKWLALAAAFLLTLFGLLRVLASFRAWGFALFQDVPYILDSLTRRAEFRINREFDYQPASREEAAVISERSCWRKPPLLLFSITMLFIAFGPTLHGFCATVPQPLPRYLPLALGAVLAWVLYRLSLGTFVSIRDSIRRRLIALARTSSPGAGPLLPQRRNVMVAVLGVGTLLLGVPLLAVTIVLFNGPLTEVGACGAAAFSWRSLLRLLVVLGAILAFVAACRASTSTSRMIYLQALIVAVAWALLWFVLATPDATEALETPYRHVFGALAPAILIGLAAAPLTARIVRPGAIGQRLKVAGVSQEARECFRWRLPLSELFVPRTEEPHPVPSRVISALAQGVSYRVMQLLLIPALLGFVAPADWLVALTSYGFVISILLGTWANLSRRWHQMSWYVERMFLSGSALFVSLFVIVVAACRVAGIDYVTTIVDAAPFGVLFAFVVMSYALSWLVEYWINRMIAVELLEVLGGDARRTHMPYPVDFEPQPRIRVEHQGRYLSYHGFGRFLVVGTVPPDANATGEAAKPAPGFHTYELFELFRALGGANEDHVSEVVRYSNLYFFAMNAILVLLFAGFVAAYVYFARATPVPVVEVAANVDENRLEDLAGRLIAPAAGSSPAIIVVASGGGTRAALYTSHVLQGLHALGADHDIVLLSGVSGGGVALAYFAANFSQLTQATAETAACWERFRRAAAENLIGDVLQGASEWRIFARTPLSMLLAESMDRHLLRPTIPAPPLLGAGPAARAEHCYMRPSGKPKSVGPAVTMALAPAPPLILNTTIVGHPADDSEVLAKTLSAPAGEDACEEASRPYNMMSGGRLVFTNVRSTDAFPGGAAMYSNVKESPSADPSPIPNTRLPYVVVTGPDVPLARAAALNANFPPVFPNARVQIAQHQKGQRCAERSYYVTDGGAQENLGLVSALYAIQSALNDVPARCGNKACKLRPLHFVLAEASAAGYDYAQDRGIAALGGGAKERLTGGLTNVLIDQTRAMYEGLGADAKNIRFHYLPLPLAFRARGGFGTHWMHAERFELSDPRPRVPSGGRLASTTIKREDLEHVWLELHDPQTPYCERKRQGVRMDLEKPPRRDGSIVTDTVRRWICGTGKAGEGARDLHVQGWQGVVKALRR